VKLSARFQKALTVIALLLIVVYTQKSARKTSLQNKPEEQPPLCQGAMAEPDAFTHTLAISLARELNLMNPNDLLATRVIGLVQNQHDLPSFSNAASTFGKFRKEYLEQTYREIKGHLFGSQPTDGLEPQDAVAQGAAATFGEIKIMDADVMMPPSNAVPGGLARRPGLSTDSKHVYSKPSLLGLDKLAQVKREEREQSQDGREKKRARIEESVEQLQAEFKSELHPLVCEESKLMVLRSAI
jgi:hypothetical protein